ncbi:Gfo/Idh/MocA family protein [Kitasatospora sp. NPDC058048]|uniref:Gfo/Idh/MocA family protein n=1 Tax=Kitasatospora sp. NPDC058048 TaxID=3346313 RepID=UPI0036DC6A25
MTTQAVIPVAVVGGGRVASAVHIPLLLRRPDLFDLVAVVEPDSDRSTVLGREFSGLTVGADLEVAFDKGARAVICATPWPTHRDIVTEVLDRGIDVLVEKPASLDPGDLKALIAAEQISGANVAVGYMKRHDPAAVRFVELVSEQLDRVRRISVDIVDPDSPLQVAHRLITPTAPKPESRVAAARIVAEVLADATAGQRTVYERGIGASLIHQINLVHTALAPHSLVGHVAHGRHWANGSAAACGWWPSGEIAVQMSHIRLPGIPEYQERIEVVTDDARILLEAGSPYLIEQGMRLTEFRADRVTTHGFPAQSNGFVRQLEHWAAFLRRQGPALPSTTEALRDLTAAREAALACTGVEE